MTTINLLPPSFKRIEALDRAVPRLGLWLGIACLALSVSWGTALVARWSIREQSDRLAQQITDQESAAKFDTLSNQVRSLAGLAEEYQRVFQRDRVWEELFTYLEQTVPADTVIDAVTSSADKTGYTVTVTGNAADRRSIGLFRENLLSYRSQDSQPERVSQVIIESIAADNASGRQQFSLRLTFNLDPVAEGQP